MSVRALAETGALLGYLDRSDRWHEGCRAGFVELRLPLVTSKAVLTELFHLVGEAGVRRRWPGSSWGRGFSRSLRSPIGLPDLLALMRRYHDRPMGFADATLVHIAKRESVSTIFTVDHHEFETYRIGGRKRFRILPER